jgi:hypothetical protein
MAEQAVMTMREQTFPSAAVDTLLNIDSFFIRCSLLTCVARFRCCKAADNEERESEARECFNWH